MNLNEDIFNRKKEFFDSGNTKSYSFRIHQLEKLKETVKKYEDEIFKALQRDLGKSTYESYTSEIGFVYEEINYAIKNLKRWMKSIKVRGKISTFPSKQYINPEPLGVVLIISPWNYPFQLSLTPLVGAIAAGNCAIVNPSMKSKETSAVLGRIIDEAFTKDYISALQGAGSEVVPDLTRKYRFNHIFFTGSERVGKEILNLAAVHLTPVTLELGGKSPTIVYKSSNLDLAAKRIVAGKYYNAGQTCIAPDYLLVHENEKNEFILLLIKYIKEFFGDNPKCSNDYGRIINENKFKTLTSYFNNNDIIYGGDNDIEDLYIAPTLLECKDMTNPIMKSEIFGPLLPILTFNEIDQVIDIIKINRYPLALYLFTDDPVIESYVLNNIEFGGGCINNTLLHLLNLRLPFGGVGNSGIGRYHGKYSFDTFTHYKSILKSYSVFDVPLRYPPYYEKKLGLARRIMK